MRHFVSVFRTLFRHFFTFSPRTLALHPKSVATGKYHVRETVSHRRIDYQYDGGAANAATYTVTSILDGTDGAFDFSLFHDQSIWRMDGNTIADPAAGGITPGTWDSVTGAISFGSLLQGAGSFFATGRSQLEHQPDQRIAYRH